MTDEEHPKFDFESCKRNLPEEKVREILKAHSDFVDTIREERRRTFYSLPNDESKLAWLRKAIINSIALNTLIPEFFQPFRKDFIELADFEEGKEAAKEVVRLLITTGGAQVAFHVAEQLAFTEYVIYFREQKKKEASDLEELKKLYEKETP